MQVARHGAGAIALVLVSAAAMAAAAPPPARLTVCVVSLNEPYELDVFRSSLDPARFEFVDIRDTSSLVGPPAPLAGGQPGSWLLNACRPQTQCDMVVYTAEFAGHFFGTQGASLSLQDMEEASCQPQCAGLFHHPLEVFLLACNTLATKDQDRRTPEEYLQVLLSHDFDRGTAERVVELRYGPLGPSFREALRRIFAGVPRIYGFSSVAPIGRETAPRLARYLRETGDYADALQRAGGETRRNTLLLRAFEGTSMIQTGGLSPSEPGARDRTQICALYDQGRPVLDRLRTAYGLLRRPDALRFVPTLEVFLSRHPPQSYSPVERSVFAEIQALEPARDSVLQLARSLNVSALKLELAHFAFLVGWLHRSEFHALAATAAAQVLREPLSSEVVDIMCSATKHESLRDDFDSDDVPAAVYNDPQGLRLVACLAPADPRVGRRVVPALRSTDPYMRQWGAYALTQLKPRDEETLIQLVPYLRDPSPEVSVRIEWLFQAVVPLPSSVDIAVRRAARTGR